MSIINKMLQDLEQRHPDGVVGGISGQVRAVPYEKKSRAPWLIAALLAVLLGGVLAWFWLKPVSIEKSLPIAQTAQVPLALKTEANLNELPQAAVTELAEIAEAPSAPPLLEVAAIQTANAPLQENAAISSSVRNDKPLAIKPAPAPLASVQPAPIKAKVVENAQAPVVAVNNVASPATNKVVATDTSTTLNKQVKELTPQQRAENDYRKATSLVQQGRTAEAISLLEQVLQADAANAAARQTLIALLISSKRQDDAMRYAQEGLNLDAKQTGFAMILARLQVEKGDQQLAINTLQRSLPYALERAEYQAFLAALLQREGRHKDAIEHYLVAVRKTPQSGLWWMGMGISMQADKRDAEAREAFTRARETQTLSPELQAFVDQKLKQLPR